MESEVQFLLSRRSDVNDGVFFDTLRGEAARASGAGLTTEVVALVPPEALAQLAHVAESGARAAANGILTVRGDPMRLMSSITAAGERMGNAVDLGRSSVIGAQRFSVLPGIDSVRLFFGLRRLEHLTRAEFLDYWLNRHAEFGRRLIPPYTYHQIHARAKLTDEAARLTGVPASLLDGIVEVHFPDIEALIVQLSRPDVAKDALEDERNFIDHSRSAFQAYRSPPH